MATSWQEDHPLLKGIEIYSPILIDKDFVVVIDTYVDIFWATSGKYDKQHTARLEIDRIQQRAVLNEAALLEETPTEGLDDEIIERFKRLIGEAIVCGLEYDFANARRM